MINTLKADFYRLFRSKAFWITNLAHIIFIQAAIFMSATGGVGVQEGSPTQEHIARTSAEQIVFVSSSFSMIEIFIIVFLAIILGNELSQKLYKNTLTAGQSRSQFFISKYIVILFLAALEFIIFYVVTFVENAIFNGVGEVTNELLITFLKTVSVQYLCALVWISIVSFVLYLTHSNVAGLVAFFAGTTIMSIPKLIFPKVEWLNYLNFSVSMLSTNEAFLKTTLLSVILIIVFSIFSLQIFKRKDL